MRFLYGLIFGVMLTTVGAILYLAFTGGEYLLQLSPAYQEMRGRLVDLERVDDQRAELAGRLDMMAERFSDLSRRFEVMQAEMHAPQGTSAPEPTSRASKPASGDASADELISETETAEPGGAEEPEVTDGDAGGSPSAP